MKARGVYWLAHISEMPQECLPGLSELDLKVEVNTTKNIWCCWIRYVAFNVKA